MIYKYTVSDQECNIVERRHVCRLPSLFHVHRQITCEVHPDLPVTVVMGIAIPSHPHIGYL